MDKISGAIAPAIALQKYPHTHALRTHNSKRLRTPFAPEIPHARVRSHFRTHARSHSGEKYFYLPLVYVQCKLWSNLFLCLWLQICFVAVLDTILCWYWKPIRTSYSQWDHRSRHMEFSQFRQGPHHKHLVDLADRTAYLKEKKKKKRLSCCRSHTRTVRTNLLIW